jgi:hypothetical protein
MRKAWIAGLIGICMGCPGSQRFSGDELIGTFSFTADIVSNDCPFAEVPDSGFAFQGTFSRDRDAGTAYLTVNGVSRGATFDGQYVTSQAAAPRQFAACRCQSTVLDETLKVALLSASQVAALPNQGQCPANPLDGGVPIPDGGILPPGSTGRVFDALRACGELTDVVVVPDAGCSCPGCRFVFRLQGIRQ